MNASPGLVVRGLACRRGERILFDGFDLEVAPGELVWLRAANGFGKTTLLRALAGLSRPETGSIAWHGNAATPLYLAHANALKDDLTVTESVRDGIRLHGLTATEGDIADAIRRVGLQARRHAPIRTLSQGQRRRVALARLCLSPSHATWLLDEPYDALDASGVVLVDALLAAHAAAGGNVLFTSHVAPTVTAVAVRAVQFDAARLTTA